VRVGGGDWSRYWRSADEPLEAMYAHFREHVYHRHSHDAYSFGVTESGAQSFTCRGAAYTSAAGMVMAFNPDDPHDGRATTGQGFSYRMIHVGPGLLEAVLADIGGRPAGRPLFATPVVTDPGLAVALRRLHRALTGPATPLERGERLTAALGRAARAGSVRPRPCALPGRSGICSTGSMPRRSPATTWPLLPGAAATPRTGLSGPWPGWRPVSTSASFGCATPGGHGHRHAGRGRRGVRRPGPPDPLVPALLRDHPRGLPKRSPPAGCSPGIPRSLSRLLTDFAALPLVLSHPVHHN
jgi:hypothetical protein